MSALLFVPKIKYKRPEIFILNDPNGKLRISSSVKFFQAEKKIPSELRRLFYLLFEYALHRILSECFEIVTRD